MKIIRGFKDHRIKLINLEIMVLLPLQEKGIKTAKEIYCFLDSDDMWHKDKLQICLKLIKINLSVTK